jgi:hypothetical protein
MVGGFYDSSRYQSRRQKSINTVVIGGAGACLLSQLPGSVTNQRGASGFPAALVCILYRGMIIHSNQIQTIIARLDVNRSPVLQYARQVCM